MSPDEDFKRQSQGLGPAGRLILGTYLHGLLVFLVYLLARLWPIVTLTTKDAGAPLLVFGRQISTLTPDLALLWAVGVLGALGGSLHAVGSFVNYIGNRVFVRSWIWFYVARAPVGLGLAVLFFFAMRGGLLTNSGSEALNPYGMGALGALTGLCSEIATHKLREIFTTAFRPAETRADPVTANAPRLLAVRPPSISVGSGDTEIAVAGGGFTDTDVVMLDGAALATTFVSDTELTAKIPAARLATTAALHVMVRRSGPRGVASEPFTIEVA